MNLQRLTHPGAGFTTAVVLACGIVSGAAMAAGNTPANIPTPKAPQVAGIPSIPTVPQPKARVPWMEAAVPAPTVQLQQAADEALANPNALRDALVLRPETPYKRQEPQPSPERAPTAEAEATPIATAKPLEHVNFNGLGLFLFALLGAAGYLAYRKKQEQVTSVGDHTLEVASTIRVGAKWQVSLVRVPGRMLVVGSTDKGLELLTELYPEGDEDAMQDVLSAIAAEPAATPRRASARRQAPEPRPEPEPEDESFDLLDALEMTEDRPRREDTYQRPPRRHRTSEQAPAAPAPKASPDAGHDDAFLDAVLERLSNARPAVIRRTTTPAPRVDERTALRAQVKQYRRGPTRL